MSGVELIPLPSTRKHGKHGREGVFWGLPSKYVRLDGFGAAWQLGVGVQSVTKETRATSMIGLPVGEFDLVAAAWQCLNKRVKALPSGDDGKADFGILALPYEHAPKLLAAFAQYYNIEPVFAKAVFKRFHNGGSMHPDAAAESDMREDELPCLLELKHVLEKAYRFLAATDELYKKIFALPSVQNRETAFAIYLQHLMTDALEIVSPDVEEAGLRILAYVFDGVYVLAESEDHLMKSFETIAQKAFAEHHIKLSLKKADGTKLKDL